MFNPFTYSGFKYSIGYPYENLRYPPAQPCMRSIICSNVCLGGNSLTSVCGHFRLLWLFGCGLLTFMATWVWASPLTARSLWCHISSTDRFRFQVYRHELYLIVDSGFQSEQEKKREVPARGCFSFLVYPTLLVLGWLPYKLRSVV